MDEPKSLYSLFQEKLFRIPDYQRGYAWRQVQLVAFWEDLVNSRTIVYEHAHGFCRAVVDEDDNAWLFRQLQRGLR